MRWKFVGAGVLAFLAVQFVQPGTLPVYAEKPLLSGAQAPESVLGIINRSCRDCHSYNTVFPWYSRISPFSWAVAKDVEEGRTFLNFSQWENYSRAQKMAFAAAMASVANQERMPPKRYVLLHPDAALSPDDRKTIKAWARSEFRRLSRLKADRGT
jgi:hypothetical protein